MIYRCGACGGLLEVRHDLEALRDLRTPRSWKALFRERLSAIRGFHRSGVWRYHELVLPDLSPADAVTLGEGNTGLYRLEALERRAGAGPLHLKHEGQNPSLSFKDRGMTAGVSWARRLGVRAVACASTGDTSAALALYAARAEGLAALVVVPRDGITLEQLGQPLASGCRTIRLDTDFDGCIQLLQELARLHPLYLLNSLNSIRLEGQKTIAFEILQQLDWEPPDWIVMPVGNAGNVSALAKGFSELRELGILERVPRLAGVQAAAAAPLARAFSEGAPEIEPLVAGETIATAIRIGNPVSAPKALSAVRASQGVFLQVDDAAAADAKALVDASGVSICPNSGVAVAGWLQLVSEGVIGRRESAVVVGTAHGIKFSRTTLDYHRGTSPAGPGAHANPPVETAATLEDLERAAGLACG
ncbi:MAG: threonine synthase [Gemmatimonadetes bacterium]|nr:threonine synthase [Gemmatimonadota bacterium]